MFAKFSTGLILAGALCGCQPMSGTRGVASMTAAQLPKANSSRMQSPQNLNACQPFRAACEAAGFKLGAPAGNRLISNCMVQLVKGAVAVSPVTNETAQIPESGDAAACQNQIHSGTLPNFKSTAGTK